ncbi:phosphonate metabolism protein/1,5-bisphosphokinase (PRPP-forming) PhnN [Pseudogemmobacter faecipullorum]|uniref:Ribose 1,5-bisphosphate phosphokinase PhnN n=1 Tax=Pseudogemmobacter faecipullorum TaxID=2755041 RepID=A0ABS8CSQ3_9RHOB|nr:phosphonate metabolism protein/1,5-bisphosphokinase (PRPP-forming) PhnN [Pseudogemmobacter faecipullorum]MCB5412213.1 phosphonate metabolism protein/1,5-bisphosphokinase (PRPP-forming) PhnN [Pseudogemmobacter faecipullorum]
MRLVAVVGPSGAGKDTLMALACAADPGIRAVRRVITRPSEAGGEEFEGVSEAEFSRRLEQGEFALHWQAHGLRYGIPRQELTGEGVLLFNCSRAVLSAAREQFPGLEILLVTAPAAVLAGRLAARGREAAEDRSRRLARAEFALPEGLSPLIVQNDSTAERGLARFLAALQPCKA